MRAGDRGRARTCNFRVRSPMLYPVELRGPGSGQNHPRCSSCSELNPGLFKRAPDRPGVRHRDRRLTVHALGSRQRLRAKLAGAGKKLSIPVQQVPSRSYL